MNNDADNEERPPRSNWLTTTLLIVIWVFGLMFISKIRPGIPTSMLLIGSVFFIVLIPAMNEMVSSIERRINDGVDDEQSAADKNRGENQGP